MRAYNIYKYRNKYIDDTKQNNLQLKANFAYNRTRCTAHILLYICTTFYLAGHTYPYTLYICIYMYMYLIQIDVGDDDNGFSFSISADYNFVWCQRASFMCVRRAYMLMSLRMCMFVLPTPPHSAPAPQHKSSKVNNDDNHKVGEQQKKTRPITCFVICAACVVWQYVCCVVYIYNKVYR